MSTIQAILLAIIEGVTEFLPVSSTGHMVLASSIMGIAHDDFTKLFTIAIQFGTILSVMVLYFKRFFQTWDFYIKIFVAFIPAVIVGLFLGDFIDSLLENPISVAIFLVLGGLFLLKVDDWFGKNEQTDITYKRAFKIGLYQTLAVLPGVSRSGASIVGGMAEKLSRTTAAEFSFFLAVPTIFGATVKKSYDFFQAGFVLDSDKIQLLIVGNVVGFIVAMIAIKGFIGYLSKHGFKMFGYYRILVGIAILIVHFFIQKLTVV